MSNWTPEQYRAHQMRLGGPVADALSVKPNPVERELRLHGEIMLWCVNQVPAIPYIHARPDRSSGIAYGAQDFTLFIGGRVVCIECKAKDGKLSEHQQMWSYLMDKQGFKVHIVRSLDDFLAIVQPTLAPAKERELI